jgi:hypothetical protein
MNIRKLLISSGIVLGVTLVHMDAVGEDSSGVITHLYSPTNVYPDAGLLMNKAGSARTVFIPLTSSPSLTYKWCASLAVGVWGDPPGSIATFGCRLSATCDSGTGSSTPIILPDAAGKIIMNLGPSPCAGAYLECTMPVRTWLSNVKWNHFYIGGVPGCGP